MYSNYKAFSEDSNTVQGQLMPISLQLQKVFALIDHTNCTRIFFHLD